MTIKLISVIILGYLIGGIPFGMIITRLKSGIDITQHGSGKIGATNVLRTAGKESATAVLFCDILKGLAAVLLARWIMGAAVIPANFQFPPSCGYIASSPIIFNLTIYGVQALVAMAVVIGHNWSPYIKFQGGRGVASFFGGLILMNWLVALVCGLGILMGVSKLTHYVSLGSILSVTISAIAMLVLFFTGYQPIESAIYAIAGALFIVIQHRDNIMRLRSGTERKIGVKAEQKQND